MSFKRKETNDLFTRFGIAREILDVRLRKILKDGGTKLHLQVTNSVTRFGEISKFWPEVNNLWQIFIGLISVLHYFEPTLAQIYGWGKYSLMLMHKYRKISIPSGHTADKQTYIGDDLCGRVSYAVASFTYRERERQR